MRSKGIEKFFREKITALMSIKLPQFERLNPNKVYGGSLIFRRLTPSNLYCFAIFQFSDRTSDAFTVEFGWSPERGWHSDIPLSIPIDLPSSRIIRDEPVGGKFRFRISLLWPPHKDDWWVLTPEPTLEEMLDWLDNMGQADTSSIDSLSDDGMNQAQRLIDDAVGKLLSIVIPFFDKKIQES
jgi:hypothetical protein